jgi:hypothetical protein
VPGQSIIKRNTTQRQKKHDPATPGINPGMQGDVNRDENHILKSQNRSCVRTGYQWTQDTLHSEAANSSPTNTFSTLRSLSLIQHHPHFE